MYSVSIGSVRFPFLPFFAHKVCNAPRPRYLLPLFLKNEEQEVPSFSSSSFFQKVVRVQVEKEEDATAPNAGAPSFPPLEQLLLLLCEEHRRCCFAPPPPPPLCVFEEEEEATFCAKALPPRANVDDDDDAEAAIIPF
jgi:hypothetical protein